MSNNGQPWQLFKPRLSIYKELPNSVFMKAKDLPCFGKVVGHKHNWDQLIYAVDGLLEVNSIRGDYLIPSGQAIWIPANQLHSIATIQGAQLRSVHITRNLIHTLGEDITVLTVNELTRELIKKASTFAYFESIENDLTDHQKRFLKVMTEEISQLCKVPLCLPLSNDPLLLPILVWQQQHPEQNKTLELWANELGACSKTIARRFKAKLGVNFTRWREMLRLHKAVQYLNEAQPVTEVALSLGYESLPAFIQMFKKHTGTTPGKYIAHINT